MAGACFNLEQLQQLLGEKLTAAEQSALLQHLDACADCRQRLESLAAGTADWFRQAAHVAASASPQLQQVIQR